MSILTERQVQALVDAALRGVRQIKGARCNFFAEYVDKTFLYGDKTFLITRQVMGDARCATGVIMEALCGSPLSYDWALGDFLDRTEYRCPAADSGLGAVPPYGCGAPWVKWRAQALVMHLNDYHGWDFLTIARKLG